MSGFDAIKKALKDSGLLIPADTSEEMLAATAEEEETGIFCKLCCRVDCTFSNCDLGHCVISCQTACSLGCNIEHVFGEGSTDEPTNT